jgi:hypothetical protein
MTRPPRRASPSLLNANIAANATERFVQFVAVNVAPSSLKGVPRAEGWRRAIRNSFPRGESNDGSVLTWAERFHSVAAAKCARNQLIVTPAMPLTPGSKWKLMLRPVYRRRKSKCACSSPWNSLGAVRHLPFEASPSTSRQAGRRLLSFLFSKALKQRGERKNVGRWILVAP